jgi:hypothetical protein
MPPDSDGGERPAAPGRRYSTFVGLAFFLLIVVATLNTIGTEEGGILGTSESDRGLPLPEFAIPDVAGSLEGDANVYQDDCSSSANPCPAGDRRTPACQIDVEGAIRVCDLFDRPLAISFLFLRGSDCLAAQDAFDHVARRYGDRVNFLIVDVRDDRDELRQTVAERGWDVPVGYDADGAVSDLYRVGVCPTVQYAYPGGIFEGADFGDEVNEEDMAAHVRRLIAGSARRAETTH